MQKSDILVVDDEIGVRDLFSDILSDEGWTVETAESVEEARKICAKNPPKVVLLDVWLNDSDGLTLLREWTNQGLIMSIIVMSGHASIDTAVEATKMGALNFLEKPVSTEKLINSVKEAFKHCERQYNYVMTFETLGNSQAIQELRADMDRAANQKGNVLLTGEPGCPFDIVAEYFQKSFQVFVHPQKPEEWLDPNQEFYKSADKGVLYLGDVSKLKKPQHDAIYKAISQKLPYDVKVVGACSKPLQDILVEDKSNVDLLNILSCNMVYLPPLRNQLDDLVHLINHIQTQLVESRQVERKQFKNGAIEALKQYTWPGNLNQLEMVVKSIFHYAPDNYVDETHVNHILDQYKNHYGNNSGGFDFNLPLRDLREEVEKRYFEYHIRQENNNMSRVAQRVGLERTHLYRKLKQLGIQFSKRQSDKS